MSKLDAPDGGKQPSLETDRPRRVPVVARSMCPLCQGPNDRRRVVGHRQGGVYFAHYLCAGGHLWSVKWSDAAPPVSVRLVPLVTEEPNS